MRSVANQMRPVTEGPRLFANQMRSIILHEVDHASSIRQPNRILEDLNKLPDAGCGFALPLTSGHRGRPKYYSSRTARVPRVLFGIFQSMHSVNQTLYLVISQDLLP